MDFSRNVCLTSIQTLIQYLSSLPDSTQQLSEHPFAETTRIAAVFVPIVSGNSGEPLLLFTKRSANLKNHPGEVSFPGGSRDPIDATLRDTALRETTEEIGLMPEKATYLLQLSPVFTYVSNFVSTPFVFYVEGTVEQIAPQINHDEVEDIIVVPLAHLANPANRHTEQRTRNNHAYTLIVYTFESHVIWGATARMISELVGLLPSS